MSRDLVIVRVRRRRVVRLGTVELEIEGSKAKVEVSELGFGLDFVVELVWSSCYSLNNVVVLLVNMYRYCSSIVSDLASENPSPFRDCFAD